MHYTSTRNDVACWFNSDNQERRRSTHLFGAFQVGGWIMFELFSSSYRVSRVIFNRGYGQAVKDYLKDTFVTGE